MEYTLRFRKLWRRRATGLALLTLAVAFVFLCFQSYQLVPGYDHPFILTDTQVSPGNSSVENLSSNLMQVSAFSEEEKFPDPKNAVRDNGTLAEESDFEDEDEIDKGESTEDEFVFVLGNGTLLKKAEGEFVKLEKNQNTEHGTTNVVGGSHSKNISNSSMDTTKSRTTESDILSLPTEVDRGNETEDTLLLLYGNDYYLEDVENESTDEEFFFELQDGMELKKAKDGFITLEKAKDGAGGSLGNHTEHSLGFDLSSRYLNKPDVGKNDCREDKVEHLKELRDMTWKLNAANVVTNMSSLGKQTTERLWIPKNGSRVSNFKSSMAAASGKGSKKVLGRVSPKQMNRILSTNHASGLAMIPRWPSEVDRQILDAREKIGSPPIVKRAVELYAHAFRNVSKFKRSYELMEQMLKVYIYEEGERPMFHQPIFTGIYASEGWFMKLMENSHFHVRDPAEAHLFYIPFSSYMLRKRLYVNRSHSLDNLVVFLREYVRTISTKYPFWNRTGGADHFLAACHDWAPHETRNSMNTTIRALCNADLREGFVIGKDVSLPETNVQSQKDPLRDLGGIPAKERKILAFFSGNLHGQLRTILLQQWENKDPSMKILGPIPRRRAKNTMTYIEYMKNSMYCICPRGYEVNSPRVVEAIFYECVPVIISDNYVPPFFEVLNWRAFSIIIAEKDIPRLKEILTSIPRWKYLSLQKGVRKVQQHFLWHKKPVRYDLFHMILHSVWFNRIYQMRM